MVMGWKRLSKSTASYVAPWGKPIPNDEELKTFLEMIECGNSLPVGNPSRVRCDHAFVDLCGIRRLQLRKFDKRRVFGRAPWWQLLATAEFHWRNWSVKRALRACDAGCFCCQLKRWQADEIFTEIHLKIDATTDRKRRQGMPYQYQTSCKLQSISYCEYTPANQLHSGHPVIRKSFSSTRTSWFTNQLIEAGTELTRNYNCEIDYESPCNIRCECKSVFSVGPFFCDFPCDVTYSKIFSLPQRVEERTIWNVIFQFIDRPIAD